MQLLLIDINKRLRLTRNQSSRHQHQDVWMPSFCCHPVLVSYHALWTQPKLLGKIPLQTSKDIYCLLYTDSIPAVTMVSQEADLSCYSNSYIHDLQDTSTRFHRRPEGPQGKQWISECRIPFELKYTVFWNLIEIHILVQDLCYINQYWIVWGFEIDCLLASNSKHFPLLERFKTIPGSVTGTSHSLKKSSWHNHDNEKEIGP